MGLKEIALKDLPAIGTIESRLLEFSPDLRISAAAYDFDQENYSIRVSGTFNRTGDILIHRNLLDDLRDNPEKPGTKYSLEITRKLDAVIQEKAELFGLLGFSLETLQLILLRFIADRWRSTNPVNKYNAIGRGDRGDLERTTNATFGQNEKETLFWAWGELLRTRLIIPTGTDHVAPDDWVKPTELGITLAAEKSLVEFKERLAAITNEKPSKPAPAAAVEPEILDDLLPIFPRREYTRRLPILCSSASKDSPLSLVMIDIDHFKKFNDSHGHSVGDKVLILVSTTIKTAVVGKGYIFRTGGEEIVVLLPNHDANEAMAVAERVRRAVEEAELPEISEHITISLGVSTLPHIALDGDQLYNQADHAMYDSKDNGRNRTTLASAGDAHLGTKRPAKQGVDALREHRLVEARSILSRLTYTDRDFIRFVLAHGDCSNQLVAKAARVGDQITYGIFSNLPQLGIVNRTDDLNSGVSTYSVGENWREIFTELLFPREEGGHTAAFSLS